MSITPPLHATAGAGPADEIVAGGKPASVANALFPRFAFASISLAS
jgi:hypothetical protein